MIWVLTEKLVRFFGLALDLLSLFFALFWVLEFGQTQQSEPIAAR